MTEIDDLQYQETIAILQEELARLEAEARGREGDGGEARRDPGDAAAIEALNRQVAALTADRADRDEIIALLVEQVQRLEESGRAARADRDELNLGPAEVEGRAPPEAGPENPWSSDPMPVAAGSVPDPCAQPEISPAAFEAVERENAALRARLLQAEAEARGLRSELEQARADRSPLPEAPAPEAALSIDNRIRALRQHLLDIHEQEARGRPGKSLSSRLSRLWNRTSEP